MRIWLAVVLSVSISLFGSVGSSSGQQAGVDELRVESGVTPDTVTVGEHFHSAMRVLAPAGYRVEYGELVSGDSLQSIGPVSISTVAAGADAAIYELVAWAAGTLPVATVTIRVIDGAGVETTHEIALALPEVASVLPPPEVPIEPRPAKGVIERTLEDGLPWWWLLVILAAILAAILAYRRLRRSDENGEAIPPREWAFSQLDAIAEKEPASAAEVAEVYRRSSWVLRGYLARIDPRLGPDLATGEVEERMMEVGGQSGVIRSLRALLDVADRVKFAGQHREGSDALAAVAATREWIATYPPAEVEEDDAARRVA